MKPAPVGAPISNVHGDDVEQPSYTIYRHAVQVSRPSTLRTLDEAAAAKALWLFDTKTWLRGPPLLTEYGCNLETPSSDELLARLGSRS